MSTIINSKPTSTIWSPTPRQRSRTRIIVEGLCQRGILPQIPTRKQFHFLCYEGKECLFGGAAGPGKSSGLLMAASMFVDYPLYSALILRRTYADLALDGAIMDRAKEWWSSKAHWSEKDKRFTWPSGATITFGYLESENDKYRYQGAEFQFIGFDELTQFRETQYRYLISRLRKTNDNRVPLRMRSASNPGGVGGQWVKKRFVVGDKAFIPARLEDNPHLSRKEYEQSLMELDPVTRDQLLRGDWDAEEEGRFKREWFRYYETTGSGSYRLDGKDKVINANTIKARFMTVDHASTVKSTANEDPDYTVITAWIATTDDDLLAIGCFRTRCEVPDIPRHVAMMYQRHNAGKVYIEGGGTQKGPFQLCQRFVFPGGGKMNCVAVNPRKHGDKLQRATAVINMMEAGRVFLPIDNPNFPLDDVESELVRFTGVDAIGVHDDIVDTFSMAGQVMGFDKTAKKPAKPMVRDQKKF